MTYPIANFSAKYNKAISEFVSIFFFIKKQKTNSLIEKKIRFCIIPMQQNTTLSGTATQSGAIMTSRRGLTPRRIARKPGSEL